jgi:hypothetical protein
MKMKCPLADYCQHKQIWDRPEWDKEPTDKFEGVKTCTHHVLQGHCKEHEFCPQCAIATDKCPACVEVK